MFANIGANVKQARKARGITQRQLAEKIGIAEVTLRQYENGVRNIKLETLVSISNALNIMLSEMVDLEQIGFNEYNETDFEKLHDDALFHAGFYENDLLSDFALLNVDGQNKALELVKILTEIPRFRIVAGENNGDTEE